MNFSALQAFTMRAAEPKPADQPGAPRAILSLILAAFVGLECLLPLGTTVQIGADEGFNLAKATLCLKGFKLYTQVWNYQPPLHTFLITEVLKHISPSVLGPRLVTVGFALLLLASLFALVLRISGLVVATIATAMLIASPGFLELSSSCMLEIPALATGMTALCVLMVVHRSRGGRPRLGEPQRPPTYLLELLSGLLFGAALQIKFAPALLLPLAALLIAFTRSPERTSKAFGAVLREALPSASPKQSTARPERMPKASSPSPMRAPTKSGLEERAGERRRSETACPTTGKPPTASIYRWTTPWTTPTAMAYPISLNMSCTATQTLRTTRLT